MVSTEMPQWLRPASSNSSFLGNGKIRFIVYAIACMALGWLVTSRLGPDEATRVEEIGLYQDASGGVLVEPSGYGAPDDNAGRSEDHNATLFRPEDHSPSVKAALAELHHAVADKIQSWSPYRTRPESFRDYQSTGDLAYNHSQNHPTGAGGTAWQGEYIKDGLDETDRLGARTRIGKCTILFNGNTFWERALKTHEEHDRLHGYRLHVLRQQLMDDVWSKPAYILSLLLRELAKPESERLEWLFWVDADTIILNPRIPIETFLPPPGTEFGDVHLLYSNDWNGLNNGVFPVRVNRWSVQLFSAITSYRYYKPTVPLVFRDQSAMLYLMNEPEFVKNIVQTPQRWFNAYQGEHNETLAPYQIRRGDLLVHFAGVPNREERMGYWLQRAEQHNDDWEIPVRSTSYPQEVQDFWDGQRGLRRDQENRIFEIRQKATQLLTQVEVNMNDFGDRLSQDSKTTITTERNVLQQMLQDERLGDKIKAVEEQIIKLELAAVSLTSAVSDGHKVLLSSAHEAIFAGEKDLLDGGFANGISNPELVAISEHIEALKKLIMTPEDQWDRGMIIASTNDLTEARGRLQEKVATLFAEQRRVEEEAQKLKAEEDARLAAIANIEQDVEDAHSTNTIGLTRGEPVIETITGDAITS